MADLMDLETRKEIYDTIVRRPGVHLREIARLTGIPLGTIRYQLSVLQKKEYVEERTEGGYKRYYAKGKIDRKDKQMFGILRKELLRGIVVFLLANERSTPAAIQEAFEIKPSKLSYHLKKLVEAGILGFEDVGRTREYYLKQPEKVVSFLMKYRETFRDKFIARYFG